MDIINKNDKNYSDFVVEIKNKIKTAQYEAFKAVNQEMLKLYWSIGEEIVKKQEKRPINNILIIVHLCKLTTLVITPCIVNISE